MGIEEVLSKICEDKDVNSAFFIDEDFYRDVIAEEGSVIESSFGMPLANRALEEVQKRRAAVCIFCYSTFEPPSSHVMIMEDGNGNVVGHDVPKCMCDQYKDDPDVFWLCEDFAMYPHKAETEEMIMVMLPQKAKCVGEGEGVKDPVLMYPATTTDILLRQRFGVSLNDSRIASAILAFDIL